MTERGLPTMDSAPACPFVAFEDDREARATSPDHRHRCYAELVPSPRAAAHQEAYCLSSAFPVCPTFQDWARREAAHARGEGERPRAALTAEPETADHAAAADGDAAERADERAPSRGQASADDPPIRRNPHRDWAAPPPWAPGGAGAAAGGAPRRSTGGESVSTPGFLADRTDQSRGLAGSAADRLAVGPSTLPDDGIPAPYDSPAAAAPDEELAGLVAGRRAVDEPRSTDHLPPSRNTRRPSVSSTRASQRERERERERDAVVGPSWERSRRFEAYPTIRARTGLSAPPRLAILAGALVIAAVALFFLPALFGVGSGGPDAATPAPSASQGAASASPEPSVQAAPTAQVYVIKAGDTMSKVANSFGLTLAELLDANKDTITNPDKVAIGDQITIPAKPQDQFTEPSASPAT